MENEIDLENALKILFFSHSTSTTSSTIKTVQQPTNTNALNSNIHSTVSASSSIFPVLLVSLTAFLIILTICISLLKVPFLN